MGVEELKAKKAAESAETAAPTPSIAEARAALVAQMKELDRLERTTGPSGALSLTPKEKLLDARDVQATLPDKRIRWVNVNSDKAAVRQASGYERVPMGEGGRQVGNLALFALPRDEYERRVADVDRKNKERLESHKTEVEATAEAIARELRDKHGIRGIDASDIIIKG